MGKNCPHCGCTEIELDAVRGDATCTECGAVLEESTIVSDVQFQETGGGGHSIIGQFVSSDGAQPSSLAGVRGLCVQESREVTLQKGRRKILEIGSQLRVNQHCLDTAFNFFKMSVSRGLTRGRMRTHVVAACLYMTCRTENTPHLLLDFSDVTQVNVYDLGTTFSFLSRALRITLPPTDPCLYVMRFASMLKFGDREKDVVTLATRLVQRMKRDWIGTGRRPTGLCGAALLLAGRSCNFNRTVADIVRVVHVGETAVRKRLEEFGRTPSSSLTLDEFVTVDLEQNEDPPSFRDSKVRKTQQVHDGVDDGDVADDDDRLDRMQQQLEPVKAQVEKALERTRRDRFKYGPFAKLALENGLPSKDPELAAADSLVCGQLLDQTLDQVLPGCSSSSSPTESFYSQFRPTLQSLGIQPMDGDNSVVIPADHHHDDHDDDGQLDLTGIDDDEIESYILSEPESVLKSKVWMRNNASHMKIMEERLQLRREQEKREKNEPRKRKKRRIRKEPIVATTAAEAMQKVIHEKKLSKKINYEVLRNLGGPDETPKESNLHDQCVPAVAKLTSRQKMSVNVSKPTKGRRRPIRPVVNVVKRATTAK